MKKISTNLTLSNRMAEANVKVMLTWIKDFYSCLSWALTFWYHKAKDSSKFNLGKVRFTNQKVRTLTRTSLFHHFEISLPWPEGECVVFEAHWRGDSEMKIILSLVHKLFSIFTTFLKDKFVCINFLPTIICQF